MLTDAAQYQFFQTRVTVTAYCDRGLTASGTVARDGVVAVDPHRFRMGSIIRIVSKFGREALALLRRTKFRAEDTGGYIIGNHIDVWMPDCNQAILWGKRVALVQVAQPRVAR